MHFVKLTNKFELPAYTPTENAGVWAMGKSKTNVNYDKPSEYTFGIWGVKENKVLADTLLQVLPTRYRDDFVIQCARALKGTMPHVDPGRLATINFYVTTGNCTTKFFKFKDPGVTPSKWRESNVALLLKDLELVESFVAQPGDAYILDVTIPHSVVAPTPDADRTMVCLSSNIHSYETVVEMLRETGNI